MPSSSRSRSVAKTYLQPAAPPERPSRQEAEAAVRTLLRWAGDDPDREGLLGTPDRVVRSYEEYFAGYATDPAYADKLSRVINTTLRLQRAVSTTTGSAS